MGRLAGIAAVVAVTLVSVASAVAAGEFDPAVEAQNYSKIKEREAFLTGTPAYRAMLEAQNARDQVEYPQLVAGDPERDFAQNICSHRQDECAGDVRFYDWAEQARGIVRPVLFTARDGATISGNVWATQRGPRKRPGVVITTGGLAPETLYWGFAATLARHVAGLRWPP